MRVSSVKSYQSFGARNKSSFNYVKWSGYGALGSGILCAVTAKKRKPHKFFALSAILFSLMHVGILESYRFKKADK